MEDWNLRALEEMGSFFLFFGKSTVALKSGRFVCSFLSLEVDDGQSRFSHDEWNGDCGARLVVFSLWYAAWSFGDPGSRNALVEAIHEGFSYVHYGWS